MKIVVSFDSNVVFLKTRDEPWDEPLVLNPYGEGIPRVRFQDGLTIKGYVESS
ncbi:MAG: hypothetical protein QUS07_07330 [Methanothrix sp.]|nr:hypothetical protein [Methanothrix sp.]